MDIAIKRIYDPPDAGDGTRVLVDRLWPRGMTKADASIDIWARGLAPSTELRTWFSHEKPKFKEFAARYERELAASDAVDPFLSAMTGQSRLTLLYAARDTSNNHAVVLRRHLQSLL